MIDKEGFKHCCSVLIKVRRAYLTSFIVFIFAQPSRCLSLVHRSDFNFLEAQKHVKAFNKIYSDVTKTIFEAHIFKPYLLPVLRWNIILILRLITIVTYESFKKTNKCWTHSIHGFQSTKWGTVREKKSIFCKKNKNLLTSTFLL